MQFIPASRESLVVFVLILSCVIVAFLSAVYRARAKTLVSPRQRLVRVALGFGIWMTLLAFLVQSGFLAADPMRVMVLFALSNAVAIGVALSPVGGWLAQGIPLAALVAFQSFRLPLELVLHTWVEQGTIPSTMSWEGSNFDIFTGVLALVAARWVHASGSSGRSLAWLVNGVGIVLLLNVMRVAVLSSPLPFAWATQPPLLLGFYLPYALIVPVCVSGALFGHIVLTRALLSKDS